MRVPFIDLKRAHAPIKSDLMEAVERTLDHGGFCLGPEVAGFEAEFARAQGLRRVVGVGSGTEALHLIAKAMNIGPGDEVIAPAFSFIATAWFAEYVGATLVFADIDPATFTLAPDSVESLVTRNTRAIVATHLFGQPAEMDALMGIAERGGIKLVEDAAQAHLARYEGQPIGGIGHASAFSFYPTKNLGGLGEGGCVASPDETLLSEIEALRAHGSKERYLNHSVGYNNRMEGIQAATLRVKLPYLAAKTRRRQEIARKYREGIDSEKVDLPATAPWGESVYHMFTVQHPDRDRLKAHLLENGVGCDIVYPYPLHLQPCFSRLGYAEGSFPVAEELSKRCLSLPIVPELEDDEVDYVIETVNAFSG